MRHSSALQPLRLATLALATAGIVAALFLLAPRIGFDPYPAGAASPVPWTAVGSTGAVDEQSTARFGFTNAGAGYSAATSSLDPLEFRYNVTNTFDNNSTPNIPLWTSMVVGGVAPGNSYVRAQFYKVDPCTGAQTLICQASVAGVTSGTCVKCTFANNIVDFSNYVYYVRVLVDRSTVNEIPWLYSLRVQ